jgi:hypothetical protein
MLKWIGIAMMLGSAGLMISILPYASNIYEFFSLPSLPRMIFFFVTGTSIYLFGRNWVKK